MGTVSPSRVSPSPTLSRSAYLRHCVRVSLLKRWPWLLLATLIAAAVGWQLRWSLWEIAVGALAILLLGIGWIALSSWRRHAGD